MELQGVTDGEYRKEASAAPVILTDLHRQLIALYLHNPFEDDVHLLHSLRTQSPDLTIGELKRLKQECNLETHEAVCRILLRNLFSSCGGGLNTFQLRFVRKMCLELNNP